MTTESLDKILELCRKRNDSKGQPKPTPGVWYQSLAEIENIIKRELGK